MSTDPTAILYYGFPVERGELDYYEISDEWLKERRPPQPDDESDYRTPAWDEWRAKLRAWEKTPENIEMTWSGADECEAFYVHAAGLQVSVEWDEQKPLREVELIPRPDADVFLREFCERFGISWKQPGWHLACRYF